MYQLNLGRKAAPVTNLRRRPSHRRDFIDPAPLPAADALSTEIDEAVTGISDVEVVQPVRKRYRGVVIRNRSERAIVEFDADETADLYRVAEELIPHIPPEAWTTDATNEYGYLERVDEVADAVLADVEEIGDAVDFPADGLETLTRRARHVRLRRKEEGQVATAELAAYRERLDVAVSKIDAAVSAADAGQLDGILYELQELASEARWVPADAANVQAWYDFAADINATMLTVEAEIEAIASQSPGATLSRRARRRGRKEDVIVENDIDGETEAADELEALLASDLGDEELRAALVTLAAEAEIEPDPPADLLARIEAEIAAIDAAAGAGDAPELDAPERLLSRRRSHRSRRRRARKENETWADDSVDDYADEEIYAALDQIESEANAAIDGELSDADVMTTLTSLKDRLASLLGDSATNVAPTEITAMAAWLDGLIADLDGEAVPEVTLARRRSVRGLKRMAFRKDDSAVITIGRDTLASFRSQAEQLEASDDVDGLASLASSVDILIGSIPVTDFEGAEVPGARELIDEAVALGQWIEQTIADLEAAANSLPDDWLQASRGRRRAA